MRIVKEGETEREWMSARSQQPDDKDTVAEAPKAFILLWQIFIAQLFLYRVIFKKVLFGIFSII